MVSVFRIRQSHGVHKSRYFVVRDFMVFKIFDGLYLFFFGSLIYIQDVQQMHFHVPYLYPFGSERFHGAEIVCKTHGRCNLHQLGSAGVLQQIQRKLRHRVQ